MKLSMARLTVWREIILCELSAGCMDMLIIKTQTANRKLTNCHAISESQNPEFEHGDLIQQSLSVTFSLLLRMSVTASGLRLRLPL
jgi:hypothetical protein